MADGLSIPGVSDKYKTNDLVEALMEVERIPLKREESNREKYQGQQDAWRVVNQKVSTLRESVKTLYSFDNPFNSKNAGSSDENAITADADRDAEVGDFKIEVVQEATADRFLSGNIDKNYKVEAGRYVFGVGDKTIDFNWKGGKLPDFVKALNKRGTDLLKASVIGVSKKDSALLIEGLKEGAENKLVFKEKALEFAMAIDMVGEAKMETTSLSSSLMDYKVPATSDAVSQADMPALSKGGVTMQDGSISIPARNAIEIPLAAGINADGNQMLQFSFKAEETVDITESYNNSLADPDLPDAGSVTFGGITIYNEKSDASLDAAIVKADKVPLNPIEDSNYIAIRGKDGSETPVDISSLPVDEDGNVTVSISLDDYPDAEGLIIRNSNTGKAITMSVPQSFDAAQARGYNPKHAITSAGDATLKYEGITITRGSNDIDDIVPEVTLHVHGKTDRPATISVTSDKDAVKDALITFVGNYNQVLAEINILTSNKPEIITELDYLSSDEKEKAEEKLGMFMGDFTLNNGKSSMQRIVTAAYQHSEFAEITMLNQIGISSNAATNSTSYSASRLRGYLEIDEKKLDSAIDNNLEDIKKLFGYDKDGDLIADDGIAYMLEKQTASWTQAGGIIASKMNTLDSQIENSNKKISELQVQLDRKESNLKAKYSNMEGTLNSLESQQKSIQNAFSNNSSNNK
ncbi:MAG: flagellar filament capping protein FliD [Treponema sp.]|nr:flagellar filament capping protein FliD [Treponema sp.]